jgi:hypothetical protein
LSYKNLNICFMIFIQEASGINLGSQEDSLFGS